LDPARFFRVNRQLLVAAHAVRHYASGGKGRLKLLLQPEADGEVVVSQERANAFKSWLEQAPASG
jgi:DNA-binding LytR/AlgR family response regulator